MNVLHPAAASLLAVAAAAGRVALDRVDPALGEAWQRGIEALTAAVMVAVFVQFSPGDPPRRPWAALMCGLILVLVARIVTWQGVVFGDVKLAHALFIAANLLLVGGVVAFNRVLGSSELLSERTDDDRWRVLAFVGLLALGAASALIYNTWEVSSRGWPETTGQWIAATSALVSTLSDAFVCAGGVYLVWLVRPMIGGSLARPYLLLAVSGGTSLVVDFILAAAGAVLQTEVGAASTSAQLVKLFGCLTYALIGLAAATQLWLLRSAGRRNK